MSSLRLESLTYLGRGPIDLTIQGGECVALGGASGAGKSLLLRAIVDLDRHGGKIFLDGRESLEIPAPDWRAAVGMLPAEGAWWFERVLGHFPKGFDENGREALEELGFEADVLGWEVNRLSTGERQRLAILRLLSHRPRALLLDEPTASLDPANVGRVEALLSRYRERNLAPVVWVSHEPEQGARVASRRFELRNGRLQEWVPS